MKRLIVNADDFGMHALVNAGIIEGHQRGMITSTSLLAVGDAYEEAIDLAKKNPRLGIGIHTALIGGLKPLSPINRIPSLVTKEGIFFDSHTTFIKKAMLGEINYQEVFEELSLQFEKIMAEGITITHVDGHQHLHMLPKVRMIVQTLMKQYKLKRLRLPKENYHFMNGNYKIARMVGKWGLSFLSDRASRDLKRFGCIYPDYFWGMMQGGHLTKKSLLSILQEVKKREGVHEIMVHPGKSNATLQYLYPWGYRWEEELEAMTDKEALDYIAQANIRLIHFGDLDE